MTARLQKAQVTIQFIRKLLEAGAEIDTLDRKDRTPIMVAAEFHPDPGYEFEKMSTFANDQPHSPTKVHFTPDLGLFEIFGRPDSQNHLI